MTDGPLYEIGNDLYLDRDLVRRYLRGNAEQILTLGSVVLPVPRGLTLSLRHARCVIWETWLEDRPQRYRVSEPVAWCELMKVIGRWSIDGQHYLDRVEPQDTSADLFMELRVRAMADREIEELWELIMEGPG